MSASSQKDNARINVIQAVHRQPRLWFMTMKPPAIGPATGPMKTAPVNNPRASPRSTGPQKSASAPPMTAIVDAPKTPWRKRKSMIVSMLRATATGIWKMAKMK